MSMKVERSTLDQVKKRFELNKRKREEKKKDYDFESRMQELREEVGNILKLVEGGGGLFFLSSYMIKFAQELFCFFNPRRVTYSCCIMPQF